MKKPLFRALALGGLWILSGPGQAQLGPDLNPIVQSVTDRHAERVQAQAVERALQQAEAAQNRVVEQTQAQQVEAVQSQVVERVESQVERAQAQATERAQNQVERVQGQVERVQGQVERAQGQLERVQNQAAERAQERIGGRAFEALPAAAQQAPGRDAVPGLAAAVDDAAVAQAEPGTRRAVNDVGGNGVFVELTVEPGVRAVEFEWVMLVTPAQRQQLASEAGALLAFLADSRPYALTQGELLTFRVPPDLDADAAILELVPANLRGLIDRNHVYAPQNEDAGATAAAVELLPLPMAAVCPEPLAIGLIDSAIDAGHAAFAGMPARGTRIHSKSFLEAGLEPSHAHGTAVAGLLVGEAASDAGELRPLLPGASLYSAEVFHHNETAEQGATVLRILAALDWLLAQPEVRVVNMSLAGPPNRLLEQAVTAAAVMGKVVVAAAGNEGAHGPVRYPAAYPAVVGVTAVARDTGIFRWANQGPHLDYAALGVEVPTALAGGGIGPESGTSLAAPVVAAFFACALAQHGDFDAAIDSVQAHSVDLGEPGFDPVYGKGLLHP